MKENTMIWRYDDGADEKHVHRMPLLVSGFAFWQDLGRYSTRVFAMNSDVSSIAVYSGRGQVAPSSFLTRVSRGDAA